MPGPGVAGRADDDTALLRRVAARDQSAFEVLYRAYQARVFGYLLRVVGDRAVAEELVNDVLVEVWNRAAGFREESRVSTWIFGIAHHKAMNELRRRRVAVEELTAVDQVQDPGAVEPALLGPRLVAGLKAALRELTPAHREVVELTFNQGLSYAEIAQVVGCPVNTVKTRMFHARRELRAILERLGITPETV